MIRLGKYTVIERLRFDNPAWPLYVIYCGERLIGKSFSVPDLGCCEWLERQELDRIRYAEHSAALPRYSLGAPIRKRGRPSNAERAARAAAALEAPEEVT